MSKSREVVDGVSERNAIDCTTPRQSCEYKGSSQQWSREVAFHSCIRLIAHETRRTIHYLSSLRPANSLAMLLDPFAMLVTRFVRHPLNQMVLRADNPLGTLRWITTCSHILCLSTSLPIDHQRQLQHSDLALCCPYGASRTSAKASQLGP